MTWDDFERVLAYVVLQAASDVRHLNFWLWQTGLSHANEMNRKWPL